MPGKEDVSPSVTIFETALTGEKPVETLLKMAKDYIAADQWDNLHDIDVMLVDRFIEYLRSGTMDDLKDFKYAVLAFTDSEAGDRLKEREEEIEYFYRWLHFHDLCDCAVENYDPQIMARFLQSRKYGETLMELLYSNPDGIRHVDLAGQLDISPQYLSKILREFEAHLLITRERINKVSIIKLGIAGRLYMKEKIAAPEERQMESLNEKAEKYTEVVDTHQASPLEHRPLGYFTNLTEDRKAG